MERLLTDAELELMRVVWASGPVTVRELRELLPDGRAYTTVSTILRILVEKGFLEATPRGRVHVYGTLVGRSEYQVRQLRHVVDGLFDGSPLALVRQLVRSDLAPEEKQALQALVDGLDEEAP